MRGLTCGVAVAAVAAVAGCGEGDPFNKQPISGTVTVKGKPLPFGQIFFEPAAGQKFATNATVKDGQFSLTRETGLSPGKYKYRLQSLERLAPDAPTTTDLAALAKHTTPAMPIPDKHKEGEVEVKAGAENKLDIAVP